LGKVSGFGDGSKFPAVMLTSMLTTRRICVLSVYIILVRGSGKLGLLVSPARRVGDTDVGLRIDGVRSDVKRPDVDQVRRIKTRNHYVDRSNHKYGITR